MKELHLPKKNPSGNEQRRTRMAQNRSPGNSHIYEGSRAKRKAEKEPKNSEEIQEQVVLWTRRRAFQEIGRDKSAQCHRGVKKGKD